MAMVFHPASSSPGSPSLRHLWHEMGETVHLWCGRAISRRELAELDDAMLQDIGLTRADAEEEADKPFWQP